MTERVFKKGNIEYKLKCVLSAHRVWRGCSYRLKLHRRDKGKRLWREIKGYEGKRKYTTDMEDILLYLEKEEVLEVANIEHQFYVSLIKPLDL